MVTIWVKYADLPPHSGTSNYRVALENLLSKLSYVAVLEPMARLYPDRRVSVAQMLVQFFNGNGLSTPLSRIHPIHLADPELQVASSSVHPYAGIDQGIAMPRPVEASRLLVTNHERLLVLLDYRRGYQTCYSQMRDDLLRRSCRRYAGGATAWLDVGLVCGRQWQTELPRLRRRQGSQLLESLSTLLYDFRRHVLTKRLYECDQTPSLVFMPFGYVCCTVG